MWTNRIRLETLTTLALSVTLSVLFNACSKSGVPAFAEGWDNAAVREENKSCQGTIVDLLARAENAGEVCACWIGKVSREVPRSKFNSAEGTMDTRVQVMLTDCAEQKNEIIRFVGGLPSFGAWQRELNQAPATSGVKRILQKAREKKAAAAAPGAPAAPAPAHAVEPMPVKGHPAAVEEERKRTWIAAVLSLSFNEKRSKEVLAQLEPAEKAAFESYLEARDEMRKLRFELSVGDAHSLQTAIMQMRSEAKKQAEKGGAEARVALWTKFEKDAGEMLANSYRFAGGIETLKKAADARKKLEKAIETLMDSHLAKIASQTGDAELTFLATSIKPEQIGGTTLTNNQRSISKNLFLLAGQAENFAELMIQARAMNLSGINRDGADWVTQAISMQGISQSAQAIED